MSTDVLLLRQPGKHRRWMSLVFGSLLATAISGEANQAPTNPSLPQPEAMVRSVYSNANNRPDPFWPVKLKSLGANVPVSVDYSDLQLQGILWDPEKPVAIISRQRVGLNQTVAVNLRGGVVQVKAVSIQRTNVVLKIGDRQVELRLER